MITKGKCGIVGVQTKQKDRVKGEYSMAKNTAKLKGRKKRNSNVLVRNNQTRNHITPSGKRLRKEAWLKEQQRKLQDSEIQGKYEKLTTVSSETLKIRTKEAERAGFENNIQNTITKRTNDIENDQDNISELVNLFDGELIELTKVYCSKSGAFLFEYSNQMVQESIKLLGVEKTKEFLKLKRKTEKHYHPITIYNNPENLRELNDKNPVLYWIIAANKFFNSSPETLIEINEALQNKTINLTSIVYCNELLRRYLGLSAAGNSAISQLHKKTLYVDNKGITTNKVVFLSLFDVVKNQEQFNEFTSQLKAEIYNLIKSHCKVKRGEILQEQQLYLIDLAMIKNALCGDTSYFRQKKIRNATQEESIKFDMLEIFDDEMISSMKKMDSRRDHLDNDPPVPLHIRKERQKIKDMQEQSDNFDIDAFETICAAATKVITKDNFAEEKEFDSDGAPPKPTSKVKSSNPFAGIF